MLQGRRWLSSARRAQANPQNETKQREAENCIRRSQEWIKSVRNVSGPADTAHAEELVSRHRPTSPVTKLVAGLESLQSLCPAFASDLQKDKDWLQKDLKDLARISHK